MLKTVLSPLITIPCLLLGYGSISIVAVTVLLALVSDILCVYYVFAKLKNKFVFRGFEKGLFKSLLIYTSFIALNLIVDQVNNNLGKVLLGRFQGTEIVAVYSVGYTLYQYYMTFSSSISGVFTPRVHEIVNKTQEDVAAQKSQLTELFTKVGRIQFLLLGLLASGLVIFGKAFIVGFWAGEGYDDAYYVMIILVLSSSIALIQNIGIEIQRAQNKHKFRSIAYICMMIINIAVTWFLCQSYGAVGTAIGTAVSVVIANGIMINIYYHVRCNINIGYFWKNIARLSLGLIIPAVCGIFIPRILNLYSIWQFFIGIVVYTVIYCLSMWFLGMNEYEKGLIKKIMQKIFIRGKRNDD